MFLLINDGQTLELVVYYLFQTNLFGGIDFPLKVGVLSNLLFYKIGFTNSENGDKICGNRNRLTAITVDSYP